MENCIYDKKGIFLHLWKLTKFHVISSLTDDVVRDDKIWKALYSKELQFPHLTLYETTNRCFFLIFFLVRSKVQKPLHYFFHKAPQLVHT